MHVGIISDPNNFHTIKWALSLEKQGAKVTVFSFEGKGDGRIRSVQVPPSLAPYGKYRYLSYLSSGKRLQLALEKEKVDVINALNVTPFGVWARCSGFKPLVVSAMGADIFEFPPSGVSGAPLSSRSWANTEGGIGLKSFKSGILRPVYRDQVRRTLSSARLITADNAELVGCIREWYGIAEEKLKLLRFGLDRNLFVAEPLIMDSLRKKFGMNESERIILSPRGAKAVYQADVILEGFRLLLESGYQGHHLVMLSSGYEISNAIREQAVTMENTFKNFHFVSFALPSADMYQLWMMTDFFVSAPVYDGYSAAISEGRYAGAIPIVNDIPGNREVVEDGKTGWIVSNFNARNLFEAIQNALTLGEGWKAAAKAINRKWMEEHSLTEGGAVRFLAWCRNI